MFYSEPSVANLIVDILVIWTTFFLSSYIFLKAKNISLKPKRLLLLIILGALLPPVSELIIAYSFELAQLYELFISVIILLCVSKQRDECSIILSVVSIGVEHGIKMISTVAGAALFWAIDYHISLLIVYSVMSLCDIIATILLMRIPRFRSGFQFFEKRDNLGVGIAISGVLIVLMCIRYGTKNISGVTGGLAFSIIVAVILVGFGLYLWIRRSITNHYRERMKLRSEAFYQQTLAENEQKLEQMRQSNEFLAKVVHRDNHLLSALNASIDDYFNSGDRAFRDDLFRNIQTLARERAELIDREQRASKILPSTGNLLIDGSLSDLYVKAVAHGIDFNLDVSVPVDEIIGKYLSQTELQTLLCDHIKDAIIAVDARGEGTGKILVSLSVKDNSYDVTIFDSGVDFAPDTLAKLGRERVTTHAESGGSGVGFMTTFATLRRACASLFITEFENKTPFSKSVSFRFDGLSAFAIQSYRAGELKASFCRDDVIIL